MDSKARKFDNASPSSASSSQTTETTEGSSPVTRSATTIPAVTVTNPTTFVPANLPGSGSLRKNSTNRAASTPLAAPESPNLPPDPERHHEGTSRPGSVECREEENASLLKPLARTPTATGPGGIPLPQTTSTGTSSATAGGAEEAAPLLSNGSIALAEFASLLRPADNSAFLKEHVISMLANVSQEDTLARLALMLEKAGAASQTLTQRGGGDDVTSTNPSSSRLSPMTGVSDSTTAMGSSTMTASSPMATRSSPNSRQQQHLHFGQRENHNRNFNSNSNAQQPLSRRPSLRLSGSASVPLDLEQNILRTQLEHKSVQQQQQQQQQQQLRGYRSSGRRHQSQPRHSVASALSMTADSEGCASSVTEDYSTAVAVSARRRSFLGAAALGLNLFRSTLRSSMAEESDVNAKSQALTTAAPTKEDRNGSSTLNTVDMLNGDEASHASSLVSGIAGLVDPLEVPGAVTNILAAVGREGRRVAVSAAPFAPGEVREYQPRVVPKGPAEERQLRHFVKGSHLFAGLEEKDRDEVVQAMEKEIYAAGVSVLEQGQDSRERLFLIAEGACEAIKNGKVIGGVSPGGVFGDLELMYKQAKCAATVRCITRCVIYTLDEESYRHAVMAGALQKRKKYEALTLNVPFLRCLPDYERMKVAEALVTKTFNKGQHVIRFGTKGTHMHFIVHGEVKVVGRNQGKKVEVVRLHDGDVVGELEFLFNHLTVADIVVSSSLLTTACISRHHFELILGPIQDRLKEFVATSTTYKGYYLNEAANASVCSEVSRAGDTSQRKRHRRVASATSEGTGVDGRGGASGGGGGETVALKNVDACGEILLPAKRSLLRNFTAADLMDEKERRIGASASGVDGAAAGQQQQQQMSASLAGADVGENPLIFRFPFFPINDSNNTIILGLREDGVVLSWNDAMAKLTSYPAEEVIGQNIYSFLLNSREQQFMYQAISDARNYAGDVEGFMTDASVTRDRRYTFARSDGLTRATVKLSIIPPLVSSGEEEADMLLAFGVEIKQCPHQIVDQSQWLSSQLHAILADGEHTYEERLQLIADAVNSYEETYRALTMSTEKLRVVNIRQMLGQVMMDFGAQCVAKGLGVRQRFEGMTTERAYLNAELLPECLRFATSACLIVEDATLLIITVRLLEKNGLEFLVINFNVDGVGFSPDCIPILEAPLNEVEDQIEEDEVKSRSITTDIDMLAEKKRKGEKQLTRVQKQQLRRVREAVEEQGGTMRVQRNAKDANLFFLIPFMPAGANEVENTSLAESLSNAARDDTSSVGNGISNNTSCTGLAGVMESALASTSSIKGGAENRFGLTMYNSNANGSPAGDVAGGGALTRGVTAAAAAVHEDRSSHPTYNFTTLVAEDTPAHRNMLCSYLWERRHAVLPAYSIADIERLAGVADILFIDLRESIISSLTTQDPIALLREKARQMAVVITAKSFDDVSVETYHAAGFITLKKPCTPVQAMQAIHKAEEKIFAVKQEAERIAQARETLAKNSRGAWRRGPLLGKGTFGEVFEAVDVLTGGKMAVKEMRLDKNSHRIEMFVEEIATMCNLHHPNIIHYFYCEQSSDLNVIRVFMEFAAGGTLQNLLSTRGGKLSFKEFQSLLRDITDGLAYIHSQRYVHCDIKTANVLLNRDGMGKIGDFGTARTLRDGKVLYDMQGSPLYMSPECMAAGDLDEEGQRIGFSFPTDVWSLGCVVLEMATGKPPFSHIKKFNGPAGFTHYITSLTDTPDLSPLFNGPPSIIEFVSACLNPDPARRATAQQLLQMSVFSETTDEDTKSAVQALQRAQLLHVLSKFVAFQEPEEVQAQEEKLFRFKTCKRDQCDFFDDSSSSSSGSGSGSGENTGSSSSSESSDEDEAMMVHVKLTAGDSDSDSDKATGGGEGAIMPQHAPTKGAAGNKDERKKKRSKRHTRAGSATLDDDDVNNEGKGVKEGGPSPSPDPVPQDEEPDLDVSPTPKKRSKTLSKPPPQPLPARRVSLDSDEEAEAAFFATSSDASSSGEDSAASDCTASAVAGADGANTAKREREMTSGPQLSLTPSPLPQQQRQQASQTAAKLPQKQHSLASLPSSAALNRHKVQNKGSSKKVAKKAVSVTSAGASSTHPSSLAAVAQSLTSRDAVGTARKNAHIATWLGGPSHRSAAAAPPTASVNDSSLPLPQQPQQPQPQQQRQRRPPISSGLAPLLAASFIGRGALAAARDGVTGGTNATDSVHNFNTTVRSRGSDVVGFGSPTAQPISLANVSLFNGSFNRTTGTSFFGVSMANMLDNAANDFVRNLTTQPRAGTRTTNGSAPAPSHSGPQPIGDGEGEGEGEEGNAMELTSRSPSSPALAPVSGETPASPASLNSRAALVDTLAASVSLTAVAGAAVNEDNKEAEGTPSVQQQQQAEHSSSPLPENPSTHQQQPQQQRHPLEEEHSDLASPPLFEMSPTTGCDSSSSFSPSPSLGDGGVSGGHADDFRHKIARKLRRARHAIANRSFFRIEDLAGPLGRSQNTVSPHFTGGSWQAGSAWEGSQVASHDYALSTIAGANNAAGKDGEHHHHDHPKQQPQQQQSNREQRTPSQHTGGGSSSSTNHKSQATLFSFESRPSGSLAAQRGVRNANSSGRAIVAPQPSAASQWLDSVTLGPHLENTTTSEDDSSAVPSVNFLSTHSIDSAGTSVQSIGLSTSRHPIPLNSPTSAAAAASASGIVRQQSAPLGSSPLSAPRNTRSRRDKPRQPQAGNALAPVEKALHEIAAQLKHLIATGGIIGSTVHHHYQPHTTTEVPTTSRTTTGTITPSPPPLQPPLTRLTVGANANSSRATDGEGVHAIHLTSPQGISPQPHHTAARATATTATTMNPLTDEAMEAEEQTRRRSASGGSSSSSAAQEEGGTEPSRLSSVGRGSSSSSSRGRGGRPPAISGGSSSRSSSTSSTSRHALVATRYFDPEGRHLGVDEVPPPSAGASTTVGGFAISSLSALPAPQAVTTHSLLSHVNALMSYVSELREPSATHSSSSSSERASRPESPARTSE